MSDNTSGIEMLAEPTVAGGLDGLEPAVRISPEPTCLNRSYVVCGQKVEAPHAHVDPTPEEARLAKRLVNRWYTMAIHDGFPPMWQRVAAALAQHRIKTQAAGKERV